jgi:cell division protein FtsI/penicillin-binding protein 2
MIDPRVNPRLAEWRHPAEGGVLVATPGRVRVEYSMDEVLTERIFEIMRRGRVAQGHAIVIDPRSGKLLAYVSTDEETLPIAKAYPAASIVKILTASAVLETIGVDDSATCVYRGNKYRLNRRRLDPPKDGREASLETALASSNNQCFARWALHSVGEPRLRETFERFGWLSRPAPGHEAGRLEELETDLDLGRLGSGLDGVLVTPLHVTQIASILTHGEWVEPWWIDRVVDAFGRPLRVAERRPNRPVLEREVADRLRSMMVATTKRGTAKSAFRDRRGRPRVGSINVAGKTGNLTGWDPHGRYEWFLGLAPAENPTVAVVVLQLQGHMWWRRSTELASEVLRAVFCDRAGCRTELAKRLTAEDADLRMPTLISELGRPRVVSESE